MVNTTRHGSREMRLGIFAKRPPGRPAGRGRRLGHPPAAAADRPGAVRRRRTSVEPAAHFGPRIRRWAGPGVRDPTAVTVLADGTDWIWRQAARPLPGSRGRLDIVHALEHVGACAAAVVGDGTGAAGGWLDRGRPALLAGGGPALAEQIATAGRPWPSGSRRPAGRSTAPGRGGPSTT
jgi:hypothetical protein